MASLGSATCSRCGASFAGGIARCPFCSASVEGPTLPQPQEQPQTQGQPFDAPPLVPPPARISARSRYQPPVKKQPKWVFPAAAAGILAAGAVAILLLRSDPAAAPPSKAASAAISSPPLASAAPPRAETFADPTSVDPSDLYPKAKQRAVAWNADARLVSIAASPVVGDKVDLTQAGGEIVYVFATDSTARTRPFGHLSVTVRRGGIEQVPSTEGAPSGPAGARTATTTASVKVAEPNCVFDAAAKAARASGVPAAAVMKLRYEADAALKRGVWTARVPGKAELDRVIDGQTCNIVVRRPSPPAAGRR